MYGLAEMLNSAARGRPGGPSTRFSGRARTWSETRERVARLAGALKSLGVTPATGWRSWR
uniref:AMP-dependent synthetase/ligase domain-containing protein n=1 Tax=Phenylobacterium glaciei TaxID=2803784 RepID=A0A974P2J9_9CAUL|nr:hypothetical protein JKL49_19070 [Phenylobacterium glaciei]